MTYCWICRQPADSAEHRIKRSDLINLFGSGSYKDENSVVLMRGEQEIPIPGPNSKKIKYDKNLCAKCNNDLSQPFDQAYEKFINYIIQNEDLILNRRLIDFQEVYGDDFEVNQRNLYKYFVKSFGCRLVDGKLSIPSDLPVLFPKTSFRTKLRIAFSVDEDHLLFFKSLKIAGKGELITYVPLKETRPTFQERIQARINGRIRPLQYHWSEHFKWLFVWYWYNLMPDGRLGSTWIADSQFIYLGSFERLTDEQRRKFLESS